jgi:protein-S-isoprenylcysteine O-methyltransferase Ste14
VSQLPSLGPRGEGWVVIQFVLLGLIALAGYVGGPAWGGALAIVSAIAGVVLMAAGALLSGRGLFDLGRNLTPMPHPRADGQLVESGVYAHARHPIYGGLILGSFGWGLFSASLLTLVLGVVLAIFFGFKSRREEAWLVDHYANYRAYMGRTTRFVPYLR